MSFNFNWRGPNIVKDGLIYYHNTNSYYCCDDTPTFINDISGYNGLGVSAALSGGVSYDTTLGGFITFNGTTGSLLLNSFPAQTVNHLSIITKPTTIVNAASAAKGLIGLRKNNTGPNLPDSGWYIGLGAVTTLLTNEYLSIADVSGGFRTGVTDGGSLSANTWYMLSFNWNGSYYDIYINNVLKTVVSASAGHAKQLTNPNCIFAGYRTGDGFGDISYYDGSYAVSIIYNKSLSSSEMLLNYTSFQSKYSI
jgi:hypothetical protein